MSKYRQAMNGMIQTEVIQLLTALCSIDCREQHALSQRNKYAKHIATTIPVSCSRSSQTNPLLHYYLCCFKLSTLNLLQNVSYAVNHRIVS